MAQTSSEIDLQEQLSRLLRREVNSLRNEGSLLSAAGATVPAWPVEIMSLSSYNVYNVEQIVLGSAGAPPVTISGSDAEAINLAEPFDASGTLSAGTYAVMWRAGDKNVIYVQP